MKACSKGTGYSFLFVFKIDINSVFEIPIALMLGSMPQGPYQSRKNA